MEPKIIKVSGFAIDTSLLLKRFTIVGALQKRENDYVVIGTEESDVLEDHNYCSWLYNPGCGFIYGHYGLTREQALKDLLERG